MSSNFYFFKYPSEYNIFRDPSDNLALHLAIKLQQSDIACLILEKMLRTENRDFIGKLKLFLKTISQFF